MATFRLLTLGRLEIRSDSGPVDFPAGKPLGVLIRLAIGPEPPTRRELVQLFWPRSTEHRGLQSVRQAIWLIRKTLGDVILETDGTLELRPDVLTSDVVDL